MRHKLLSHSFSRAGHNSYILAGICSSCYINISCQTFEEKKRFTLTTANSYKVYYSYLKSMCSACTPMPNYEWECFEWACTEIRTRKNSVCNTVSHHRVPSQQCEWFPFFDFYFSALGIKVFLFSVHLEFNLEKWLGWNQEWAKLDKSFWRYGHLDEILLLKMNDFCASETVENLNWSFAWKRGAEEYDARRWISSFQFSWDCEE